MKLVLPFSYLLVAFTNAQDDTEWKLITAEKQIQIGSKCASAIDGLGGLLSIEDCDTTSTYQQFMSYGVSQIRTFHVDCCLAAREEDRYTEGLHQGWFVRVEECDRHGGSPDQWFAVDQATGAIESYSDPSARLCWSLTEVNDQNQQHVTLIDCESLPADDATWKFTFEERPLDTANDCEGDPCGANGYCEDGQYEHTCHCFTGWHGNACENESLCSTDNGGCLNGGTCVGDDLVRTCHCTEAFKGVDCELNKSACDHESTCQNGGTCTDDGSTVLTIHDLGITTQGSDKFDCDCSGTGFSGTQCEYNVDDCPVDACNNHGQCEDQVNGYICHCDPGWFLDDCTQEGLYDFDHHTFTACGAKGRYGPDSDQCTSAYGSEFEVVTNAGHYEVSSTRPGVQVLTIAKSGNYHIIAKGGDGGGDEAPGQGALIKTPYPIPLVAGTKLYIIVGQSGAESGWQNAMDPIAAKRAGGGGGGGSFVWTDEKLYVVAGGGGGQSYYASGGAGSSTRMSTACMTLEEVEANTMGLHYGQAISICQTDTCYALESPNEGEGGKAGARSSNTQPSAGGGGGWYSDGQDGLESTNNWPAGDGGTSAGSTAVGGKFSSHTLRQQYELNGGGDGGFGGGGSLAGVTGQGGGGGGYTGGNGGHSGTQAHKGDCPSGGGGGSFVDNETTDQIYLFDNHGALKTNLAHFTPTQMTRVQEKLDASAIETDIQLKGNGWVYLEHVSARR